MNMNDLREWRASMGWTQQIVADHFGLTKRQYQNLELGVSEIKPVIGLACAALTLGVRAYSGGKVFQVNVNREQSKRRKRRK